MPEFKIQCTECDEDVSFEISEIAKLDEFIDRECEDAADDARDEATVDVGEEIAHIVDPRLAHDISAAIAHGDLAETRILFDRLCESLGPDLNAHNQIGRFVRSMAA